MRPRELSLKGLSEPYPDSKRPLNVKFEPLRGPELTFDGNLGKTVGDLVPTRRRTVRKSKPKSHSAACPCDECRKAIKKSDTHPDDSVLDKSENSRLKKLSPEAARTLGYIPR